MTAAQQQRLKERDHYSEASAKLRKEGKLPEAIATAEKMLAIEREVFGNDHLDVAGSLERLAKMHEEREEFAVARKQREEMLAIKVKLFGKDRWQVTDARLALADVDVLAGLKPEDRKALAHCGELLDNVRELRAKRDYNAALPLAKEALQTRLRILGPKHRLTAFAYSWLSIIYVDLGQDKAAEPLDEQALRIEAETLGTTHPEYATSLNNLGKLEYRRGDYAKAERLFRQSISIRKAALGAKHADYLSSVTSLCNTLDQLAFAATEREDWEASRKSRSEALRLQTELYGEHDWHVTDAQLALADVDVWATLKAADRSELARSDQLLKQSQDLDDKGNANAALPLAKEALEIRRQVLGEKHPAYARCLASLAELYKDMGNYTRAEALLRNALEICKQTLGEKHPEYARNLNGLAQLYQAMGDYARAEPLFRQALEIRETALGKSHPRYAASLNNLGRLYVNMGDYAKAEPLYHQSMEIIKRIQGEKHPDYASSLDNLATLYQDMGDCSSAEPLFRQELEIRKQVLGEMNPDYANSLNNLALLYCTTGEYARAEPLLKQAADIRKQVLGERHVDYANSLNNLAFLYYGMGSYARAEPLLRRTLEIRKQTLGEKHPAYARSVANLAAAYRSMGDFASRILFAAGAGNSQASPGRKASRVCRKPGQPGRAFTGVGSAARGGPAGRGSRGHHARPVGRDRRCAVGAATVDDESNIAPVLGHLFVGHCCGEVTRRGSLPGGVGLEGLRHSAAAVDSQDAPSPSRTTRPTDGRTLPAIGWKDRGIGQSVAIHSQTPGGRDVPRPVAATIQRRRIAPTEVGGRQRFVPSRTGAAKMHAQRSASGSAAWHRSG